MTKGPKGLSALAPKRRRRSVINGKKTESLIPWDDVPGQVELPFPVGIITVEDDHAVVSVDVHRYPESHDGILLAVQRRESQGLGECRGAKHQALHLSPHFARRYLPVKVEEFEVNHLNRVPCNGEPLLGYTSTHRSKTEGLFEPRDHHLAQARMVDDDPLVTHDRVRNRLHADCLSVKVTKVVPKPAKRRSVSTVGTPLQLCEKIRLV